MRAAGFIGGPVILVRLRLVNSPTAIVLAIVAVFELMMDLTLLPLEAPMQPAILSPADPIVMGRVMLPL